MYGELFLGYGTRSRWHKGIFFTFRSIDVEAPSEITVYAVDVEKPTEKFLMGKLCILNVDGQAYIEIDSWENAYIKAQMDYPTLGEITQCSVLSNPKIMGNYTVNGTITWTDANGNTHPAYDMTLNIYQNNIFTKKTKTDGNGYYSVSLISDMSAATSVRIEAVYENEKIKIVNPAVSTTEARKTNLGTINNLIYGGTVTFSYNLTERTASIYEAMNYAADFANTMENEPLEQVTVKFPYLGIEHSVCWRCYLYRYRGWVL